MYFKSGMMLCIAVKEAFHTLQEELKKEKKTLCLVDVRYVNQSRVSFPSKEDGRVR